MGITELELLEYNMSNYFQLDIPIPTGIVTANKMLVPSYSNPNILPVLGVEATWGPNFLIPIHPASAVVIPSPGIVYPLSRPKSGYYEEHSFIDYINHMKSW